MRAPAPPFLALTALALAAGAASASTFTRARVDAFAGKVEVSTSPSGPWTALKDLPRVLKDGELVRTGHGAQADVLFPDKSLVKLGADTVFAVAKVRGGDAASRLDVGSLKAKIAPGPRRHFRVKSPSAAVSVRGTRFGMTVAGTQETEVEVDEGVVGVKLKNGEETELGSGRLYRSLLVIPGRPLRLLPHPNEETAKKKDVASLPDCLHAADGSLRGSVEEIEACQDKVKAKLEKGGPLSSSDAALVREHDRDEIKQFLVLTGAMPAGDADGDAAAAETDPDQAAAPVAAGTAQDGTAAMMKEMGLPDGAGGGVTLTPDQVSRLQQSLSAQGANPGVGAALGSAASGKQLTPQQLQSLLNGLVGGGSAAPAAAPKPAASDAP